jgi:predicted kinase
MSARQRTKTNTLWPFPFCPSPPDYSLDWEVIEAQFDWIRAMAGVRQEPEYHAEGDVLVHTRMVTEALIASDEWRALPEQERHTLFAAALMHDRAKPLCTQVEPDGSITSRGHARLGEARAREELARAVDIPLPPPLRVRESIARLVRYHGLPLWFLNGPDPQRAVIEAGQSIPADHVALLAEADVRGRICADQAELLDRVALFREFSRENGCLTAPRRFASGHSRFVYFRRSEASPDHEAYDDTRFEVILMSGLPGAGKDTWIQAHLPEWPVVSLDRIRRELDVEPTDDQAPVIEAATERARAMLRRQQPFIWNATNVTRMIRRRLIDLFASYHARIRIIYVEAPWNAIVSRNRHRERGVPESVLLNLLRKLEVPGLTEAHSVQWIDGFTRSDQR